MLLLVELKCSVLLLDVKVDSSHGIIVIISKLNRSIIITRKSQSTLTSSLHILSFYFICETTVSVSWLLHFVFHIRCWKTYFIAVCACELIEPYD
jgi:hypothetical protein